MPVFAFAAPDYVLEAIGDVALDELLDRAVERLKTRYPQSERRQDAIIVDANAYSAAVQLLATEEPYVLRDGPAFFPFACRSGDTVDEALHFASMVRVVPALRWHGSLPTSRLHLTAGDTELAGGALRIEPRGHHVYYARATTDPDVVTLLGGEGLTRRRSAFPQLAFVARRSAPATATLFMLFEDPRGLTMFARHPEHWAFIPTALIHAELKGEARAYALIEHPPPDWTPPLPAALTVTLNRDEKQLAIVAAGDRDALVVFSDQLREQLSGHKLAIGIADPSEPTRSLTSRVSAELRT